MIRVSVLLLLALAAPGAAFAGSPAVWEFDEPCKTCFQGRPSPECCSFFVLESGILWRVDRPESRSSEPGAMFTVDLGAMWNLDSHNALGASLYFGGNDDGSRFGLTPRYRRWFDRNLSLDLKAGLLLDGSDRYDMQFPGFVGSLSLSIADVLSLDLIVEHFRSNESSIIVSPPPFDPPFGSSPYIDRTITEVYFGLKGRSYAAWVAPTLAVVMALLWEGSDYDKIVF